MISPYFFNLATESFFVEENFSSLPLFCNVLRDDTLLPILTVLEDLCLLTTPSSLPMPVSDLFNNTELMSLTTQNVENVYSVYHYSVPITKLYYPEPFVAAASFMHSDLWFVHILVYQYWLWFVFVFIIIFFFITFICTIRWCNMRIRPRRETRGVSRSKCGDLITATVPVSWATSIIVSESTDAIDYYDGFGTTELVVGIRAYQWGWEYYYPKDLDLNYNLKPSYSVFVGNSLKYNKTTAINVSTTNLWRFYQNKLTDQVVTPASLLALPLDSSFFFNFLNFNESGANPVQEMNAFKKARMFSKTFPESLYYNPLFYATKYHELASFTTNETVFAESNFYSTKHRYNFLSHNALLNNATTYFNTKPLGKILNRNWQTCVPKTTFVDNFTILPTFRKLTTHRSPLFSRDWFHHTPLAALKNSNYYPYTVDLFNTDTDRKRVLNPSMKIFNQKMRKLQLLNFDTLNNLNPNLDFVLNRAHPATDLFFNTTCSFKKYVSFSPNQSFPLASRNIRTLLQLKPSLPHPNHTPTNGYTDFLANPALTGLTFAAFNHSHLFNLSTVNSMLHARPYTDYPFPPIRSNSVLNSFNEHDSFTTTFIPDQPLLFQGRDELIPNAVISTYWNFFFTHSNPFLRLNNDLTYQRNHSVSYLPFFNFYYDYDFRNWQALNLLEDAIWESSISLYLYDEYLNLEKRFYTYTYFKKIQNFYNIWNREFFYTDRAAASPLSTAQGWDELVYALPFVTEDSTTDVGTLVTANFNIFPFVANLSVTDDSYENFKSFTALLLPTTKHLVTVAANYPQNLHYSTILNLFRDNFDDFSWAEDDGAHYPTDYSLVTKLYSSTAENTVNLLSNQIFTLSSLPDSFLNNYLPRFSDYLELRATAKSSIVTYNALQKVFKARFDEGRSNARMSDFKNYYVKQNFLTSSRIPFEKMLGKNKHSFFQTITYKPTPVKYFNSVYHFTTSLNFYFYDFPFLLGMKSDASRHLWFDWFAKWGFVEVQPASSSRYAIYGMPFFSKNFEYSATDNEVLNETENYLTRLSRARRNYLPNWVYTPYLYTKHNTWFKLDNLYKLSELNIPVLVKSHSLLTGALFYQYPEYVPSSPNTNFNPSYSNLNTFSKLGWAPHNSTQAYFYNLSILVDVLTRREFIYRQFFLNTRKNLHLPSIFTNHPNNPLLTEVKSAFLFTDPLTVANEYARDFFYGNASFFSVTDISGHLLNYLNTFANFSFLTKQLYPYFFNTTTHLDLYEKNQELFKNQYRPMRKGIMNMIRLHATGAIAMPIEIRLQVLASSKDVIHSWAIPSAGIKIDCVPGYSSHRVMIFLVSGIYWGQCMEICGRYHHWMPIVIYFMKRDLFFLWCTHFIFSTNTVNSWGVNDKQYSNYTHSVSFDKTAWLTELTR